MSELVQIVSPPMTFALTQAGATAAKSVLYPETWVPNLTITDPIAIRSCLLWSQIGIPYSANVFGDVSVAIDPSKRYIIASGFPATEYISPSLLKSLGVLEFAPGRPRLSQMTFDPPLMYTPGVDAIIFAPEAAGGDTVQIFVGLQFEAASDLVPDYSIVFNQPLDANTANNPDFCIRNLVPNIAFSGTQIRAHVSALSSASVISHASVGIQSSGSIATATPVELTFNGNSGISLSANTGAWSDWVNLTTTIGQSLLLTASLFNSGSNSWAYKSVSIAGNWNSSTDSWNAATMGGTVTYQTNRTHVFDQVDVR